LNFGSFLAKSNPLWLNRGLELRLVPREVKSFMVLGRFGLAS